MSLRLLLREGAAFASAGDCVGDVGVGLAESLLHFSPAPGIRVVSRNPRCGGCLAWPRLADSATSIGANPTVGMDNKRITNGLLDMWQSCRLK